MTQDRLPPPRPVPDPLDDECLGLLGEPFASAWQLDAGRPAILRERVIDRITRSARASRAFITVRRNDAPAEPLGNGVGARTLYEAASRQRRPGEPGRVRIVELAAGASWQPDVVPEDRSEWLLMAGSARLGDQALAFCDFLLLPGGTPAPLLSSANGARLYLREASALAAGQSAVLDAHSGWDDFAPGIKRRVLWSHDGEASLLYHALPGAQVPRHGHGHDEECLMLEGDVFLDDMLLRAGEYQLAPAGTVHGGVSSDTGLLLYAHGDLELDIRAE